MTVIHKIRVYRTRIAVLCCMALLSGCNPAEEMDALRSMGDSRKVWVFTQINVNHEDGELSSYYYYARISASLYDRIKRNDISRGFLLLEDVRYLGNDDKIHSYKDEDSQGELVFRIEDIKRIELRKKPPGSSDDEPPSTESEVEKPAAGDASSNG